MPCTVGDLAVLLTSMYVLQFDVAVCHPRDVLQTLWTNLLAAEAKGDAEARSIRTNLRILAAGGDGTITWVLGCIHQLKLDPMPAVGVMPLGTGNDLSLSLGWDNAFSWNWVKGEQLYDTLVRYRDAHVRFLDAWNVSITAPGTDYFEETPHSLKIDPTNKSQAAGMFWNYFSVGLDAQAAYSFHALREKHPHLASGRMLNQAWYGMFSCTSGWFCGAPPIANKLRLRVRNTSDGDWQDVEIPRTVKAVVLLNLQSYGGGRDVWGLASTKNLQRKGLVEPAYDDGLIEVVGFHGGWHTAVVMGQMTKGRVHAKRLAQAVEVELQLEAAGMYDKHFVLVYITCYF